MVKDNFETELMSRLGWLYYKQNMTQTQIAKQLGISRIKVLNLLKRAREEGLVHISIVSPWYNCLFLERNLISVFGLKDAMVVPVVDGESNVRESLGKAAALYLERILKRGSLFAVGWGVTISEVPKFFNPYGIQDLRIVTLLGGLASSYFLNPYDIGARLASAVGGVCYNIHAPAIVESEELSNSFKSDVTVRQALEMAEQADHYMVGIGVAGEDSTLVKMKYISSAETEIIRKQGGVGDILAQYFDGEGRKVNCTLHKRIVAFPIENLREKESTIGLAGGKIKVKAILGALHGRFINTLITDENTAKALLELEGSRSRLSSENRLERGGGV